MGYSRDSFYRIRELYDTGGEMALREISRSKPILKNRVEPEVEEALVRMAFEMPAFGQQRVSNELRKQGIFVTPGGVRSIWQRNDLEVFAKCLKALEARVAQDGIILTEAQLKAMERKRSSVRLPVRSRPSTPDTSVSMTPTTSATSRVWTASTSRPSSTPMTGWPSPSCIRANMPSPHPTF
jgi:hypothetical protein